MADRQVTGYSSLQITLHWAVVVLVAFQFVANDGIEAAWEAAMGGHPLPLDDMTKAYLHIAAGIAVLLLALLRLGLRVTRGAPPPPADEPRLLKFLAEAVHGLIYLLLILLPASGMVAWFAQIEGAGDAHSLMKTLLLFAIALHVAGALFQHFILRSDVLMRMFRPQRN